MFKFWSLEAIEKPYLYFSRKNKQALVIFKTHTTAPSEILFCKVNLLFA